MGDRETIHHYAIGPDGNDLVFFFTVQYRVVDALQYEPFVDDQVLFMIQSLRYLYSVAIRGRLNGCCDAGIGHALSHTQYSCICVKAARAPYQYANKLFQGLSCFQVMVVPG